MNVKEVKVEKTNTSKQGLSLNPVTDTWMIETYIQRGLED